MLSTFFPAAGPTVGHAVMCGVCFALFLLTTGWHYEVLRGLGFVLARRPVGGRTPVLLVLLGVLVAHALEVLLYAAAYWLLARRAGTGTLGGAVAPSLNALLYFSLETYSSLGYGDIVPTGALRLLAGAEALNGLLLLGWSACYVHAVLGPFPRGAGLSTTTRPAARRCSRRRAR